MEPLERWCTDRCSWALRAERQQPRRRRPEPHPQRASQHSAASARCTVQHCTCSSLGTQAGSLYARARHPRKRRPTRVSCASEGTPSASRASFPLLDVRRRGRAAILIESRAVINHCILMMDNPRLEG